MIIYIPAHFEEEDYRPSWTGNQTYPTVTIRGIFDTLQKAEESVKNWEYKDDYTILIRELDDEVEEDEEKEDEENNIKKFDINYDKRYLTVFYSNYDNYNLNEIVDEDFSAVCDDDHLLGVSDY